VVRRTAIGQHIHGGRQGQGHLMTDLKLTADHDLDLSTNDMQIVTGDDAIVQHLKIRLQFFLGEWFLDEGVGIPYWTDFFIKDPNLTAIRSYYRQTIVTTPGIASLTSLELDLDGATRALSVDFAAKKDDGEELVFDERFVLL
jgi:hypothetical protein